MQEHKIDEVTYADKRFSYYLVLGQEYGVKIESSDGESETVNNIFTDKKEAQKFIELLCNKLVTPTTLLDVVRDYIDERDFISWHMR